jgi:hypothetical protein
MTEQPDQPRPDELRLTLPYELAPSAEWGRGKFLVFDALNDGPDMADVECRLAQGDVQMSVTLGLFPGLLTRLVLPLEYLDSQRVIPGRSPHRFKCVCWGGPVDPSRLTQAVLIGRTFGGPAAVRISEPQLTDAPPQRWVRARRPIADGLHQWLGREWPGKTALVQDIRSRITEELLGTEPSLPEDQDQWGGWQERRFDATGFFRTQHDGRRWWLVTPEGHAFYSLGVDCVRPNSEAETAGNEDLFAELPPPEGPYAHCWGSRHGGDATLFDGARHNLMRALGEGWFEQWVELSRRRMVDWGFNTVGNWSDPAFCRAAGLPYVFQLADFPTTEEVIFRDFPDVFAEEYARNSRQFARQLEEVREDRCVVGYFLRNEPHWAFGAYNLADQMLIREGRFASRNRLIRWLRERYGEVEALNRAWGTSFASFGALSAKAVPKERLAADAARRDLEEFSRLMIERYVRVPSEACRKVDRNHLNLGVRYAWIAHEGLLAGADAFDVFSINCYDEGPSADVIARCAAAARRPVLIGEFHTGALDRGLPAGGLRTVRTQQDRADSYRYYVEQGAVIPELVGTHYFQWNDQHVVGRFDGENWQIGIVDICQQPYAELVAAARRSHARIYRVAAAGLRPADRLPDSIPMA